MDRKIKSVKEFRALVKEVGAEVLIDAKRGTFEMKCFDMTRRVYVGLFEYMHEDYEQLKTLLTVYKGCE